MKNKAKQSTPYPAIDFEVKYDHRVELCSVTHIH